MITSWCGGGFWGHSPSSGPPGTTVTVRGTGFDPGTCHGAAGLRWLNGDWPWTYVALRRDGTFTATLTAPGPPFLGSRAKLVSVCGDGWVALPGPAARFLVTAPEPAPQPAPAPSAEPSPEPSPEPTRGSSPEPSSEPAPTPAPVTTPTVPGSPTSAAPVVVPTSSGRPSVPPSSSPAPAPSSTPSSTPAPSVSVSPAAVAAPDTDDGTATATLTRSVPTAAAAEFHPGLALLAAGLAGVFVLLVAFPAELFNSTLEEHEDEVRSMLAGPLQAVTGIGAGLSTGAALAVFVALGIVLTVALAGVTAAGGDWPAQVLGLLIAIPVVTLVGALPEELLARRFSGVVGRFRLVPVAVLVAVLCAGVSRLLGLQPAYMYGLFAGYATLRARPLSARQEGQSVLAAIGAVGGFGLLSWLVWTPLHERAAAGDPGWWTVLADTTLFWFFVLATETLVFALIPVGALDGATLRAWHPAAWFVPQVLAATFFLSVFVFQAGASEVGAGVLLRAVLFFAGFGLASLLFHLWFRWEGRPTRVVL